MGEFVENEKQFFLKFAHHVMPWPLLIEGSPTKLRDMNVENKRFIGRGSLSDKNYVSLVEQHKLSKEYMMQARICLYHAPWFVICTSNSFVIVFFCCRQKPLPPI